MQRLSRALNFTRNFFSTQIYRYTVSNKLTGWGYRPMKLQKIAAGARAFSLPPFLEKALGSRLNISLISIGKHCIYLKARDHESANHI